MHLLTKVVNKLRNKTRKVKRKLCLEVDFNARRVGILIRRSADNPVNGNHNHLSQNATILCEL